jgi:TRAP-type uncharacterized transport system substrate-binding protein
MQLFRLIQKILLSWFAPAETVLVTIGSGDFSGVYFPTGLTIAKMIKKKHNQLGIRANVESTRGSVFNLNAIMAGYLEFGLAQSDIQYQALGDLTKEDMLIGHSAPLHPGAIKYLKEVGFMQ